MPAEHLPCAAYNHCSTEFRDKKNKIAMYPFFSYNDSLYLFNLKLCVGKIQVLLL